MTPIAFATIRFFNADDEFGCDEGAGHVGKAGTVGQMH